MHKRTIAVGALTSLSLAVAASPADAATQAGTLASERLVSVSSLGQLLEPIPDAVRLLQTIRAENKLNVAQRPPTTAPPKTVAPAAKVRTQTTVPKTNFKGKIYHTVGGPIEAVGTRGTMSKSRQQ